MRDFDAFEGAALSDEQASLVIGGNDPGTGGNGPANGLPDVVITWIEGVICNPLGDPAAGIPTVSLP